MLRAVGTRVGIGSDGLVRLALAAATVAAFLPVLRNGFVQWDDPRTFLDNPHYRGFGWAELRWMLTESHWGHYIPVTWLTLAADYVVWGMNPRGYHLTSLLIHAATAVGLYSVARLLITRAGPVTGAAATTGAAAAALLFALHPLRVESVAWATERRDVVSGLFFVLTVLAYVRSTEATGARRRWLLGASVLAHLAALLSKSSTLMTPVVLVLLDVYPLRRLGGDSGQRSVRTLARLLGEKAPHAALSIAQAVFTHYSFNADFAGRFPVLPWHHFLPRVLVSLWFYPVKTLVPVDLSPLYEAPVNLGLTDPLVIRAATGLVLTTLLAWLVWRRCPAVLTAWLAYGILLAPVAGVVPLGYHLTADRYSYVPCLAFAVLAGGAVAFAVNLSARQPRRHWVGPVTVAALLLVAVMLAASTWYQTQAWRDTRRLWAQSVQATPDCVVCRVNFGYQLLDAGVPEGALEQFHAAYLLRPERSQTYGSLARALEALGRRDAAIDACRAGLALEPQNLALRLLLASALVGAGRLTEAVDAIDAAGRFYDATALAGYYGDAARHQPDAPVPRLGLVRAWTALGDGARASDELERLRRLAPELAELVAAGPARQ
jgi:hypothetical protein